MSGREVGGRERWVEEREGAGFVCNGQCARPGQVFALSLARCAVLDPGTYPGTSESSGRFPSLTSIFQGVVALDSNSRACRKEER